MAYFFYKNHDGKEFRVYLKKAVFELILAELFLSTDKKNFETTGHFVDIYTFKGTEPIKNLKWNEVAQMTLQSWFNKAHEMDLLEHDEDGNLILTLAMRHELYQSPYTDHRSWCLFVPTHLLPLKNVAHKLTNDFLKRYAERWAGK